MIIQRIQFILISLLFLLLSVCSFPWEIELSDPTIPGMHYTVHVAYTYSAMVITFLLLFSVIAYAILRIEKLHWRFACLHIISVLPSLFLFRSPLLFFNIERISHYHLLPLDSILLIVSDCLFFCVQLVFVFYLIKQQKNS